MKTFKTCSRFGDVRPSHYLERLLELGFNKALVNTSDPVLREGKRSGGIIMWRTIVLCSLIGPIAAEKATFHNYKVFRITPTTETHVELLRQLDEVPNEFTFWKEPTSVNTEVDLMVAPHKLPIFHELMAQIEAPHQVHVDNVQTLVDQTTTANQSTWFDFESYHSLWEIYENLDDLAKQHPDKVEVVVGGRTFENRQIKGVKVSFKANNPGIFLEGGNHAREWISPATVMYILHQLLTSVNPEVRALAESHDWYIFPVFNPDGYVYTHTTNRVWRKTRELHGLFCRGSDPNRNWGYKWNGGGIFNRFPCSETYAGREPFSVIETKSMSDYIKSISDKFYAYIAFHSYSQLLMYPYGYTYVRLENYEDLFAIASKSVEALKNRYGTKYRFGSLAEVIYKTHGTTADYIRGIYNKSIVYVYELRDQGKYGFLLPPEQIIPTGEETLDSLVVMFKEAKALEYLL
ncbi:PREDICTED: zinc carboxypeptidase-like isoform X2 [Vollenhovia emeryi]|uniref:zinc carboxypeptidase-like isoform X2 n=1 Tax=Vollenhovia emeryi TaxID=411798 RepID=UPI0005F54354|nr:PREDICTED: zinc carboxypeptidase-like isoform X2 [Vollenhovia emeryi]